MHKNHIIELVEHFAVESGDKLSHYHLLENKREFSQTTKESFDAFIDHLNDVADFCKYNFDIRHLNPVAFETLLKDLTYPIIVFHKFDTQLIPLIIKHKSKKFYEALYFANDTPTRLTFNSIAEIMKAVKDYGLLKKHNNCELSNYGSGSTPPEEDDIIFLTGYKFSLNISKEGKDLTPLQRFYKLLQTEKQDIKYIYFFAIMIALVSLTLPLGIQAIIGLISGGLLIESVIVLIFLVVVATIASGWLQIQQLSMVEILQQRVFAQTALEFSFRIPRIKAEALIKQYAPELANRFFDVLNVQKSLPKILIDFTSAIIQIFFGLLLLSFYHPLFIFFALLVLAILGAIFYFTGKKGLETSIKESKFKYKVAYWLEELGRSIIAFKLAGTSNLPVFKTDMLLENYLTYRKKHFKILVKQYTAIVAFKTLVTAGLLIMGGLLVVNRQINLGQFVAAEIIILLIINSVEKLISTISVIYDLLTALDKLGQVLDMPLEESGGRDAKDLEIDKNFEIQLKDVSYTYPEAKFPALKNINLTISGSKKICVAGYNNSGKSTLLKLVAGLYQDYDGVITLNKLSVRELNITSYRNIIGDVFYLDSIFEGTIFENITVGRTNISINDVIEACKKAELIDFLNGLEKGLQSQVHPKGLNFPSNVVRKMLLARSFAHRSKLLIMDDIISTVKQRERYNVIKNIFDHDWAVLIVSNQSEVMELCDEVLVLNDGIITHCDTFANLKSNGVLSDILN